jgi:hypothetical protein
MWNLIKKFSSDKMKHWKRMYGQLWRRARLKIVYIVSKKEKDRERG